MLESHVPGNSQAWFGEGQLEKGHQSTSLAAYSTSVGQNSTC